MSDPSPADPDIHDPDQQSRWPWWMYVTVVLFVLGIAAALLGVRTCL